MIWTDDPVRDAERYEEEKEKRLQEMMEQLPVCDDCGNRIEDEYYDFDSFVLCDECVQKRRQTVW